MRTASASALVAVGCTALVTMIAAAEVFKLQFREGDVQRYRQTSKVRAGLTRGEQRMEQITALVQTSKRTILAIDAEGNATYDNLIESVQLDVESGGKKASYDSTLAADASKASDPMFLQYAGLAGKSFKVRTSPTGGLLGFEGVTQLGQEISDKVDRKHPMAAKLRMRIQETYTDEGMLKRLQPTSELLPAEGVQPGSTWTRDVDYPNSAVGVLLLHTTWTYVGEETVDGARCAHLKGVAEVKIPEALPADCRFAGGKASLDRGAYESEAWFDFKLGKLRKVTEHLDLALTASLPGAPPQTETATSDNELVLLKD